MAQDDPDRSAVFRFAGESRTLATVLDGSDVGLFVLGPSFTVEWINEPIEEYFGLDRDTVIGQDKRAVLESELTSVVERPEQFAKTILEMYEDNTYANKLTCRVLPGEDRESRWLLYQSHPIEEGDLAGGRIEQYTDITEDRRELERKTQAIAQAPIGITLTGPHEDDAPLFYANEEFVSLTGYSREEMYGWNHRRLQGPETREAPVAELRRAVEAGEPTTVELRNYRKDGTMFWNRVSIAPIRDESERITSWVGFQEDITERKEHERKLKRQNERLDEFATVVSHDLQNPLQVARGRLELIQAERDSDHLDAIEQAHEQIERIIEDLLALARSGQAVDEPGPVDLESAVADYWERVPTDGATLEIDSAGTIRADSSLLEQLIENLFRNAVDHGTSNDSESAADVTVTVGMTDDGFYVADDGRGIPEAERRTVFESGYSTSDDGTGFGLSIVEEVASAHGWTVGVTDSDSGGARFELTGVAME